MVAPGEALKVAERVPIIHGAMGSNHDLIEAHLAHLEYLGHRPSTRRQRRWHLLRLARWLDGRRFLEATPADLAAFCARTRLGAESRASTFSHVRGFYQWAMLTELLDRDPTRQLRRPRKPRRYPRPMPELDLRRALTEADEPIRAWLMLGAYAGLRCCEIAPLRGEDRFGDLLIIREQKGGDEGSVPISPRLDEALAHLPPTGWWFPRWDGLDGPISPGQLQRHANRWLHGIGIAHTMHTLRHRFVTRVYQESGRDLRVTQELARHRSIASTAGYAWVDPDDGRSVVARID